nr:hypothetical protein [Tanacetum cinerariifolium]
QYSEQYSAFSSSKLISSFDSIIETPPRWDTTRHPQFPVIHQPPQEISIQEMEDLKQQYLDEMKRLINLEYRDEIKIDELKGNFNRMITPILPIEEPDNSLSMGDEHLDTILATESHEFIKSSVESLVPIPSESEGNSDSMCDVPFHDNSLPLDVSRYQFEDFSDSNDESTLIDDDSFSTDNIEYVEASPPNSELISSESSSTSLTSLLAETNTFDNSLPELETLCFDLEEIINGSITTRFDISLLEYEAVYDDHVKEISSGSTTTYFDSSLYDSFIFDLSINPCPPANRSDFHEFADELSHIISLPDYD